MTRRGWDFFLMFLSRELKMTRRQLLNNLDSNEMEMWAAFFKEENAPKEKKQGKEELKHKLKSALMVAKGQKNRKK